MKHWRTNTTRLLIGMVVVGAAVAIDELMGGAPSLVSIDLCGWIGVVLVSGPPVVMLWAMYFWRNDDD